MEKKKITIIVPFYNEELSVDPFYQKIISVINLIEKYNFEVICIDDGSTDKTLDKLKSLVDIDSRLSVIELSRNFGKENALTAGINICTGDAAIPIDCDLQDPPELIIKLVQNWEEGFEVVLAKRIDRNSDTLFKRVTAKLFYKVHNYFSSIKIPENVGDFRLVDRVVINALRNLNEQNRFMKGLFSWVGFKTITITYTREVRRYGKTKFSGLKLLNFAVEGITSFSTFPLRMWTYIGILGALLSFIYATIIIVNTILYGSIIAGYPSIIVSVIFLGSIQLIGIGTLGEYIGKIYIETKSRPNYIIRNIYKKN